MAGDVADWVFEGMLQYLRSPLWTAPIDGFIDEHCIVFDPSEGENKLEYTVVHQRFTSLVESLLTSFLTELGVSMPDFVAACELEHLTADGSERQELAAVIMEFLVTMADFGAFRAMMDHRRKELELEVANDLRRFGDHEVDWLGDDEELRQLKLALQAALDDEAFRERELAVERSAAVRKMAVDIAMEQQRSNGQAAQLQRPKERVPLAERSNCNLFGPKKPALPPIGSAASSVEPATLPVSTLPTVHGASASSPRAKMSPERQQHSAVAPSPAELEAMQKHREHFKALSDCLKAKRASDRTEELHQYAQQHSLALGPQKPMPPTADVAAGGGMSDESLQMRVALARRFKEDLLQESRRAGASSSA